ncbi:MAG: hypothetical protein AB7S81_01115 [Bdellovibrionales bacterium]
MQQNDGLPPEAAKTIKILHACQQYRDPLLVKRYNEVEKRLEHEGKWVYTIDDNGKQINSPDEFDRHTQELVHEKLEILEKAQADFIALLYHGRLTAWARENSPLAPWREIPASAWATIRLRNVYKGVVEGPGFLLYDVRIGPRAEPEKPKEVPVSKKEEPATVDVAPHVKGRGGRPSEMPTILQEYEKRQKAGRYEGSFRSEAYYLESWFKKNFPNRKAPHPKTIQHRLSEIGTDSSAKNK